ncbi:molybdopterin-containing oxidoreductase family protein [Halanaeroarchaeum sulfurireducens]|uniref:Molybdopterin oxidoreductase n=1 Tax=Halanaeroarchaeum sulfurireducens TaxID=1604004 RepID=A0A0F7PAJ6_9EURY|nr:molybdopterin-dependent oxidoreductase [Halanaeroarchaeum sulfurireducens]AKH97190.1 molybdopterin oxidoreductase [Halanaeroarchaeum sulfurireducens]
MSKGLRDRASLTRRTLLKAGGAAAGAAALGGCLSSSEDGEDQVSGEVLTAFGNCWMCSHNCGQKAYVREDSSGKKTVVNLTGVDGHPRGSAGEGTEGTLCPKGLGQLDKTHDPKRIQEPHIRKNGELQKVEWEEAFQYTAERLATFKEENGSETFLDATSWAETSIFSTVWRELYGTPERISRGIHVCAGPTFVSGGMMGVGSNNRVPDYQNSEYIIAWGRNQLNSFAGQFEAKGTLEAIEKNGATLVTIDPQHTITAEKSDKWLPIKPRTDGALALAMANVIIEEDRYDEDFVENYTHGFDAYAEAAADMPPERAADITGLDAEDIRKVARGFAEAAPQAGISVWTGTAQVGNGWKATQNITALNGLVGNIDRPGGLRLWKYASTASFGEVCEQDYTNRAEFKEPAINKYDEYSDYPVRHITGIAHNLVPEMVENGHINGIVVHHDDPLKDGNADAWVEALDAMDLVLSIDAYWNGVSRNADIVLPEATQLEKDTLGTGNWSAYPKHTWVTGSKAAVDPQWNTKPDFDILVGIADAMAEETGNDDWTVFEQWDTHEDFIDDELSAIDLTLEDIDSGEVNYELVDEFEYESWEGDDHYTFNFDLDQVPPFAQAAEEADMDTAPEWIPPGTYGDELSEDYPLEFYDVRSVFFSHASNQPQERLRDQFAKRNELADEDYRGNYLHINPEDADKRGISSGDMVTVESETGSGELMAVVSERARPGFVTAEYGFGETSATPDGEGMNTMTLHHKQMDPITGQVDRHIAVEVTSSGGD